MCQPCWHEVDIGLHKVIIGQEQEVRQENQDIFTRPKFCENAKKMIWTSERHAKHSFAGRNTLQ